jgi:hypothetical protein
MNNGFHNLHRQDVTDYGAGGPPSAAELDEIAAEVKEAMRRMHEPTDSLSGIRVCSWCGRLFPCPGSKGVETYGSRRSWPLGRLWRYRPGTDGRGGSGGGRLTA